MLSIGAVAEEAMCEQLEKVIIGGDEEKFFQVEFSCLLGKGKSWWIFLEKILMYLHRAPMTPLGWIQISFAIV